MTVKYGTGEKERIALLHPEIQSKAHALKQACNDVGVSIVISQGLRSKDEQNRLFAQGRTTPGIIVTHTPYPQSLHNWGVAFDFAILDKDGHADWDNIEAFKLVGKLGKYLGLVWGGDWTGDSIDRPHFQLKTFTYNSLRVTYKTPENFILYYRNQQKKEEVPMWKTDIMNEAVKLGLIESGAHKPDEPAQKWFVLKVALTVLKKLGK